MDIASPHAERISMTLEHTIRDTAGRIDLAAFRSAVKPLGGKNGLIDVAALRSAVEPHLCGKTCFVRGDKLSPFLNKPHNTLVPGKLTEAAFKFHEIYPEAFKEETHFMGAKDASRTHQHVWQGMFDKIQCQYGHFDESGAFHAPIAVYRTKTEALRSTAPTQEADVHYILLQQGNYQVTTRAENQRLEDGVIRIYRGIGTASRFHPPTITPDIKDQYHLYLALSFTSPVFALSFNHACRSETSHVNLSPQFLLSRLTPHDSRKAVSLIQQSFSTSRRIALEKFGPNHAAFDTPVDNIRILNAFTGENEAYVLDPARLTPVEETTPPSRATTRQ